MAVSSVVDRLMDRLHAEAVIENEERNWQRTGRIRCGDCGTLVRTATLESLPEHRCFERQQAHR
jgi:transcription initiation factor TFIIIB Brf1 subunit/transcription initiation factor TFIIB